MKKNIIIDEKIINYKIKLINDLKNLVGIYDKKEAIDIAKLQNLSLIQVSETEENNIKYSICIIGDINKHIYEKNKNKKKINQNNVKEVVIKTNIDLPDMLRKLDNVIKHIEEGNKIILSIKRHKRGNINVHEFVDQYFKSNNKIESKITRKSERESKWSLQKKKK